MGPGGSREAAYVLEADVPAGTYHVIGDAIVIRAVDVTFELIWRRGTTDTVIDSWLDHFDPLPGGVYEAQAYETDRVGAAIQFETGDQFVFRYTGSNTTSEQAWIPNGDGVMANGRIPNITLPR